MYLMGNAEWSWVMICCSRALLEADSTMSSTYSRRNVVLAVMCNMNYDESERLCWNPTYVMNSMNWVNHARRA
jgi:hypothetical protein